MSHDYDVIIVGAGFAGVTAARECATRGLNTLVLEGRDRIGGRSGGRRMKDGSYVDVGGTFVHWSQPHTWAEITRYGLTDEVEPAFVPIDTVVTLKNGELVTSSYADQEAFLKSAYEKVMGAAATAFPAPPFPLAATEEVTRLDQLSVPEALEAFDLNKYEYYALATMFAGYSGRAIEDTSWLTILRWFAAGNDNYDDFMDMLFTWKLKHSTGSLLDAMIADGGAEVRLNTVVAGLDSSADGVTVTLADGSQLTSTTAIIATPANVWPELELNPPLPAAQREAAEAGMAVPNSGKCVAILKGESRAMQFISDDFTFYTSSFRSEDEQVVALYSDNDDFDISDPQVVKAGVESALPHVTVIDSIGDVYREDDPMFRGAFGFFPVGHLTKYRPHEQFTRLDERVVFACTEVARMFPGAFFDGAIEAGLRAARDIRTCLEAAH